MRSRRGIWCCRVMVVAVAAVLLSGCASVQRALGIGASLEDREVDRLRAQVVEDRLCPSGQTPLMVTAHLADGDTETTRGAAEGRLTWDNFGIEFDGPLSIDDEGVLTLSGDPHEVFGQDLQVRVFSRHHDLEPAVVNLSSRFDCEYMVNYSGEHGRPGAQGSHGHNGSNGVNRGSNPGENGGHGDHGGRGGDGEAGRDGPEVEVFVDLFKGAEGFLEVRVENLHTGESRTVVLDAVNGGRLEVLARGGDGGWGGSGGRGGNGGRGGDGTPPGQGGDGGDGGDGGSGGDGGDGGRITFYFSPQAEGFAGALAGDTSGGAPGEARDGGYGGNGGSGGGGAGRDGRNGQRGSSHGRPGRDGPEPEYLVIGEEPAQAEEVEAPADEDDGGRRTR